MKRVKCRVGVRIRYNGELQLVTAINTVRAITGLWLKEAKELVDQAAPHDTSFVEIEAIFSMAQFGYINCLMRNEADVAAQTNCIGFVSNVEVYESAPVPDFSNNPNYF